MSDGTLFLCCLGAGLLARLLFVPASIASRRARPAVRFTVDFTLSFLGGVPFALLIFAFRDGVQPYFTLAAFYSGLLLPSFAGEGFRAFLFCFEKQKRKARQKRKRNFE